MRARKINFLALFFIFKTIDNKAVVDRLKVEVVTFQSVMLRKERILGSMMMPQSSSSLNKLLTNRRRC